ncbi:MAG: MarR family transcriptional regulator [Actinobacteria bacterium HGW-Actinobacteria-6]|jgi:DNA-binding MarR family transcriptional regulator|nr:MAG: MarR family transcriptional regulator [Actinobacteria bacterium HGW-Actinobacteria-6]
MIDPSREQELNEALELFFFGYREFTAYPDAVLAERGLGRVHHRILYFVGRNPGVTVGELLSILGVSKQALNAPLRRLMAERLVENAVGESDRRARHLRLTADGSALEAQLSGSQRERMAGIFAAEGPDREAAWRAVMRDVAGTQAGWEA